MELQDKVAIITGILGDVELATARRFIAEGARVVLCHAPTDATDRLTEFPDQIRVLAVDSREAEIRAAVQQTISAHGRVDVLVNGEGLASGQPWAETGRTDWDRHLAANLTHVFEWCRAVGPHMRAQRQGKIVNITWNAGRYRSSYMRSASSLRAGVAYASSQGGVLALPRELAFELAAEGVYVNAAVLGLIATCEAQLAWSSLSEAERAAIVAETSLGRLGTPDEAAAVILFLASGHSSYVTGHAIDVNGGWWVS